MRRKRESSSVPRQSSSLEREEMVTMILASCSRDCRANEPIISLTTCGESTRRPHQTVFVPGWVRYVCKVDVHIWPSGDASFSKSGSAGNVTLTISVKT